MKVKFLIILPLVLIVGILIGHLMQVLASPAIPNPGHSWSQIECVNCIGTSHIISSQVQRRVSGTCAAGSSIRVVNEDGTVSCETDDTGITSETDPQVGTATSNRVCYGIAGNVVECNDNIVWDATNDRLGIGTDPGTNKLKVAGNTEITGNLNVGGSIKITPKFDQDLSGWLNATGWIPPAGIYICMCAASDCKLEIYAYDSLGGWGWYGNTFTSGVIISDGTNVRWKRGGSAGYVCKRLGI